MQTCDQIASDYRAKYPHWSEADVQYFAKAIFEDRRLLAAEWLYQWWYRCLMSKIAIWALKQSSLKKN